jgi:hypothetical protein
MEIREYGSTSSGFPKICVLAMMTQCMDVSSEFLGRYACNICKDQGITGVKRHHIQTGSGWTNLFKHCTTHANYMELVNPPQVSVEEEVRYGLDDLSCAVLSNLLPIF